MKKIIILLCLASLACSKKQEVLTPVAVAKKFEEAIVKKDFKTAEKYATKEQVFELKSAMNLIGFEPLTDYTFQLVKDSINNDVAWVKYVDFVDKNAVMKLQKIDNQWKVVKPASGEKSFFVKVIEFPKRRAVK